MRRDRIHRRWKMTEPKPRDLALFDIFELIVVYGAAGGAHVSQVIREAALLFVGVGDESRLRTVCGLAWRADCVVSTSEFNIVLRCLLKDPRQYALRKSRSAPTQAALLVRW